LLWLDSRFSRGAMPATIIIESASGLRAADLSILGGSSDPYCICEIEGKSRDSIRTPTINNNLFPVWNHKGFLEQYEADDILVFTVWDEDAMKSDDPIGRGELKFEQIRNGYYEGQIPLVDEGRVGDAFVRVKVDTHGTVAASMDAAPPKELALFTKTWTTREVGGGMRNDVNGEVGFSFTPNVDLLVQAMGRSLGPDGDRLQEAVNVTLWATKPHGVEISKVKVGPESRRDRDFAYESIKKQPRLEKDKTYYLTQSCHNNMKDFWFDGTIQRDDLRGCLPKECNQVHGSVQSDKVGSFPDPKADGLHRMGMLNLKFRKAPVLQDFDNFGVRERPERLAIRFVCMSPSPG